MVTSAGLLLYRRLVGAGVDAGRIEVLLAHMGGPFWTRKDEGAWTLPKGEHGSDEAPLDAARREFAEELGSPAPSIPYLPLGSVRQSAKTVSAWAGESDFDATSIVSATFELEWPPHSGRMQMFPEIDRAQWFGLDEAAAKLVKGQRVFLERLAAVLDQLPGR